MQNATFLMFMSLQSRFNGNMSDFFTIPCWAWYAHAQSMHVLDVAASIHIIRSVRAATFNDCMHMHLVPYLKSKITPSVNNEMNKITLPSRYRIGNSSPGGLRPSTLLLSHGGSSAPHDTYKWSLRVSGKERFVSLKAEFQSGGRPRDLPTFQADRFIITASALVMETGGCHSGRN